MEDAVFMRGRMMAAKRKAADVFPFLEMFAAKKEREIAEIEQMVERYERKRMLEERAYQSMSPFRRLISGKKPDHHLAVEYIHYVKKPMEKVRQLRQELEQAKALLKQSDPQDDIELPDGWEDEMI